ncbi:MAG: hypothetical protein JSV52_09685 [Candidatus Zixiibacteriota bacterium]|nr:MAG: hypothetical protein JSV52_09685 [candidate division Zixibacteria bacterium]
MKNKKPAVCCYIAAFTNARLDSFLEDNGFSKGMICFAIPTYGIMFRCRTEGRLIDLEFSALFSLLEFVKSKLEGEKIKSLQIFSSNPELVFAFTEKSPHMRKGSSRRTLLDQYAKSMQIAIGYSKPAENRALTSPAEYPSVPNDRVVKLNIDKSELTKVEFKPFQKGIKI